MKRCYILGILAGIAPCMCMGQSATVSKLIKEKQRKMEELEKCMGTTKGLKIAGISTIGVTAVGVAGNIVEAKKINELDSNIEKTDKKIDKVQKEIDERRADIAKEEKREAEAAAAAQTAQEKSRQEQECVERAKQKSVTDTTQEQISNDARIFGEVKVEDGFTDKIMFNGKITECESGKTYQECLGDDKLKLIAGARIEHETIAQECPTVQQGDYIKIESVKNSETPTEETQFQKTCKELGGQYTTDTFHFEGNTISADVTVHDGCVFQTSDDLKGKCSQLKQYTQYYTHINADKKLCAFIGEADLKCIEGKPDCPLLQTTPQPAQQTNVTPGQTPNQTPDNTVQQPKIKKTVQPAQQVQPAQPAQPEQPAQQEPVQTPQQESPRKNKTETINDFESLNISYNQGKQLISLWAEKKGINFKHCNKSTDHDSYDDWIICYDTNNSGYDFKFDDLNEKFKSQRNKDIAITVCEMYGGDTKVLDSGLLATSVVYCQNINDCETTFQGKIKFVNDEMFTKQESQGCKITY